ncbi:phage tail protein [Yersinia intermedia]|uniref:phage tail protein n=1 Tax=Yersinia intermedia TaxID=631 RepID=UPI001F533967|nr:phage tail protein [Yersinia intermedia]UNK21812.1 phage tail protein [Yersinia intermedia]
MTARFFALLTNIGTAKLANATALGTRLEITQMAVGDGGGTLPTPNPAQTQLVNEQRRAALNMLTIDPINTSQIIAEQVIPETEGGWWIREIGLLDKDGDLVAIANCAETYKPQLQEGSGRTQTIRMILIVSSTAAVTLKIDPSVVLATRQYVDKKTDDKAIEVKAYADDLLAAHAKSRNHPDASLTAKGFAQYNNAIDSDSEKQAATSKAVKTVAEAGVMAMSDHVQTDNPHDQYLQIANLLSEIKELGPTALAETLRNIGAASLSQLTGIVGTSRNAKISIPVTLATASFTADELIVQTALGGYQYKLCNINKTINLAASGAGGMDTGTVPISGYVALYVIYNPTANVSALLAVNTTSTLAPEICSGVMPSGYTASALVSVWRIVASKFITGEQVNRSISIQSTTAFTITASTPATTIASISSIVPVNTKRISGIMNVVIGATGGGNYTEFNLFSSASSVGRQSAKYGAQSIGDMNCNYSIAVNGQNVYYSTLSASGSLSASAYISKYEF